MSLWLQIWVLRSLNSSNDEFGPLGWKILFASSSFDAIRMTHKVIALSVLRIVRCRMMLILLRSGFSTSTTATPWESTNMSYRPETISWRQRQSMTFGCMNGCTPILPIVMQRIHNFCMRRNWSRQNTKSGVSKARMRRFVAWIVGLNHRFVKLPCTLIGTTSRWLHRQSPAFH